VPDADETARQHVQQESAQELICGQSQEAPLVFVSGVPPPECDFIILEAHETVIGDRHAMRIRTQITEHLFGSAERRFAIHNPAQSGQLTDETPKQPRLRPALEPAVKPQLTRSVSLLESFDEFATKNFAEYVFGKEEAGASRMYPARVVAGETAGGHDAMDMWMVLQLLIPGVEDAEETDLGPEAFGIRSDLGQCLGAGAEEQAVDDFFVLQCQGCQLMRKREDNMSVSRRQQFGTARFEPAVARLALALRAVPVTAGVIRDGAMAAAGTLVQMTSHGGGSAALDCDEHLQMEPRKPGGRLVSEAMRGGGYDIGQLQERPIHLPGVFRTGPGEVKRIERAGGGFQLAFRHVKVPRGRSDVVVTQQQLDRV
jgi:hypothetical protein